MERKVIDIPTLRSDFYGFRRIISIVNEVVAYPYKYFDFDFTHCGRIDQHAIAILGMLALYVDAHNRKSSPGISGILLKRAGVMFRVDTMSDPVRMSLINKNFLSHFSQEGFHGYPKGGYIGYREHGKYLDPNLIADHLMHEWLTDEKLKIEIDLKKAIVSRIFEIFMNAYGHGVKSGFSLGAVSCGQYDKKDKRLNLTVVDFGCGVCESVRNYLASKGMKESMTDCDALRWALESGNSTKTDSDGIDMPRGLGFGLLADFVGVNQGKIEIFTNSAHAIADSTKKYTVSRLPESFPGTIVDIDINCDGKKYSFFDKESLDVVVYF